MQEIVLHFFFAYTTTTLHESHVLSASLGGDWGRLKTLKETLPLLPGFYCGSMTNLRRLESKAIWACHTSLASWLLPILTPGEAGLHSRPTVPIRISDQHWLAYIMC